MEKMKKTESAQEKSQGGLHDKRQHSCSKK